MSTLMTSYGFLHVIQATNGDAFLLEYDLGSDKSGFMLIDGGPSHTYGRNGQRHDTTANLFSALTYFSERTQNPLVRGSNPYRQLESINTVVITHDNQDHKNGIADLFGYLINDSNVKGPTNVTWNKGRKLMCLGVNMPIENIWYNSQANVQKQYLRNSGSGTPGWFDDLLRHYNSKFPSLPDIIFNQEFKIRNTTDFATLVIAGSQASSTGQNVQKGQFSLCILGPSYDDLVREKLVKELEHSSTSEQNRTPQNPSRRNGNGSSIDDLINLATADSSPKNKSSIAFEALHRGSDGPRAKLLMLGDAVISDVIVSRIAGTHISAKYDIVKIAHHGSAHNSYVTPPGLAVNTPKIELPEGVLLEKAFTFFLRLETKKYVISASPTEGWSNPHITTILGIYLAAVERDIANQHHAPVDVYLTNKLPTRTENAIGFFLLFPKDVPALKFIKDNNNIVNLISLNTFDYYVRIWLLKPNLQYGSIDIYGQNPNQYFWNLYDLAQFSNGVAQVTTISPLPTAMDEKRRKKMETRRLHGIKRPHS